MTGSRYGLLTVIERDYEYEANKTKKAAYWKCICDCGNYTTVLGTCLRSGDIKSCGCLRRIKERKMCRYDLSGEFGVGYTSDNQSFLFDLSDYDLIKNYAWRISASGYVVYNNKHRIAMHRLVTNCPDDLEVDHINHCKTDNRRNNLRICTKIENTRNRLSYKNKSGIVGVTKYHDGKWKAYITVNRKRISLGTYVGKRDAIVARLKAEKEYFGEFALQSHLYEEYGI